MKLKKLVASTLSAVMCMAALTGCGGKSDSAKKTAKVIEVDLTDEQYAFGVDKDQPDLLKEVNQFVKDMKSDGTFDEICNRYFGDGTPVPVKSAAYDESKDQLVVATNAAFEPFEYMDGENYVGIDMEIAKALADKLGIKSILEKYPYEVSGGQKQRAAVARAVITQPQLLLADEPTGALDSKAAKELLKLFTDLNQDGQTIVMVTHSVKAASTAGRVLFIKDGKVFHQLYKGHLSEVQMYQKISDAMTAITAGGEIDE